MSLFNGPTATSKINATAFLARARETYGPVSRMAMLQRLPHRVVLSRRLPACRWTTWPFATVYRSIAFAGWQFGALGGPVTIEAAASVLAAS